jgi:hypothetical protein
MMTKKATEVFARYDCIGEGITSNGQTDYFVDMMMIDKPFEVTPLIRHNTVIKDWFVSETGFKYHKSWICPVKNKSVSSAKKGIKATDNVTGQVFYFYTEIQNDVENAMTLMGYGCRHYNLGFFTNKKSPMDDKRYKGE